MNERMGNRDSWSNAKILTRRRARYQRRAQVRLLADHGVSGDPSAGLFRRPMPFLSKYLLPKQQAASIGVLPPKTGVGGDYTRVAEKGKNCKATLANGRNPRWRNRSTANESEQSLAIEKHGMNVEFPDDIAKAGNQSLESIKADQDDWKNVM